MKKILFLLIAMIMVGCTVVETTEPDYYEETRCNYHFENDCGEEFIIRDYSGPFPLPAGPKITDYCGLYMLTYRDGCHVVVTYY